MKKILFSDLDNTFLYDYHDAKYSFVEIIDKNSIKKYISEDVLNLIDDFRKQGYIFAINTGRSLVNFNYVKNYIPYDYVILEHGSIILKENEFDNIWWNMHSESLKEFKECSGKIWELKEILKKKGCDIHFSNRYASFRILSINGHNINFSDENGLIKNIQIFANEYNTKIVRNGNFLDIIPKTAGKEKAALYLINNLKINLENVMAIGDDYSDFELLKVSKKCACPLNSTKEIINLVNSKNGFIPLHSGLRGSIENFTLLTK